MEEYGYLSRCAGALRECLPDLGGDRNQYPAPVFRKLEFRLRAPTIASTGAEFETAVLQSTIRIRRKSGQSAKSPSGQLRWLRLCQSWVLTGCYDSRKSSVDVYRKPGDNHCILT